MDQAKVKSIEEWHERELEPILLAVEKELRIANDRLLQVFWFKFSQNSFAFFELLCQANCINQYMMTFRLLCEMVADLSFFYDNDKEAECKEYLMRVNELIGGATKSDGTLDPAVCGRIMNDISAFKVDDKLGSEKRVERVFNDTVLYEYTSCFVHFNIVEMCWSIDVQNSREGSIFDCRRRLAIAMQYSVVLETAIGVLERVTSLRFKNARELLKRQDIKKSLELAISEDLNLSPTQ